MVIKKTIFKFFKLLTDAHSINFSRKFNYKIRKLKLPKYVPTMMIYTSILTFSHILCLFNTHHLKFLKHKLK